MKLVSLIAVLAIAVTAAAEIDLGPPAVELSPINDCGRVASRCLAVAGEAPNRLVVWSETLANGTMRLRASLRGSRIDLFEGRRIDHPAVATDGQSFLVIWQHAEDAEEVISGAQLSAAGAIAGRFTFGRWDALSEPPASVVWTGLEYAVSLPGSVAFVRDGAIARTTTLGPGIGSLAAVSGNSLLVVRRTTKVVSLLPYPFDQISKRPVPLLVTNLIGSNVGPTREVLLSDDFGEATSLAAGGDGYLIVWKDERYLRALRLDQNGGSVTAGHQVIIRHDRRGGVTALAATREGWLVLWDDTDLRDGSRVIRAAELDPNGDREGPVVTIATGAGSPALVKLGEDRFRVFYRGATAIESRLLTTGPQPTHPPRRRAIR